MVSYCDFVLAEHNSINTDLVFGGQVSQNELNSCGGFIQVDCQLVSSYHLTSDGPCNHNNSGNHMFAKEFGLWEEEVKLRQCFFSILNIFEKTEIHPLIDRLKASSTASAGGAIHGIFRSLKKMVQVQGPRKF